jgi:hypothetical protein
MAGDANGKRPWYLVALATGFGIGAGTVVTLGLAGSAPARGNEPKVATSGISAPATLPPGSISLDERLRSMESTLKTLSDDMIEVKQRLPPKKP